MEDKAIWLVQGANIRIQNIEFIHAISRDRNGAGIRVEADGLYSIDVAAGGRAIIGGNEIEQGPHSENAQLIAFAPEHSRGTDDDLMVAYNTLVNDRATAVFVVNRGTGNARICNNLIVGSGTVVQGAALVTGNVGGARQ